jgi:hypothetical protein
VIKEVWVELVEKSDRLKVSRIFRSLSASIFPGSKSVQITRSFAVHSIRSQIFERSKGECELCSAPVTWDTGHMHEQIPRGKGGEISLENSVFVCAACHKHAHRKRNPQWTKRELYR